MTVSVNGQPNQSGPVLIDTGIAQMYLTVSDPTQLSTQPVPNPGRKGATTTGLASGVEVTVSFPDADGPMSQYRFTVGDNANEIAPSVVLITRGARQLSSIPDGICCATMTWLLMPMAAGLAFVRWCSRYRIEQCDCGRPSHPAHHFVVTEHFGYALKERGQPNPRAGFAAAGINAVSDPLALEWMD